MTADCTSGQLEFALESRPMDSGMSQFYWNLRLTNVSDAACTLEGYPQVRPINATTGEVAGAPARQQPAESQGAVAVLPGASAYSLLHLSQAGVHGCPIVPVTEATVIPPQGGLSRVVATPNRIDGCDDGTTELVSTGMVSATPRN